MTTNNLGVRQYKLMSGYDSMMRKVNRMQESGDGVYVRFDDCEALQAAYEEELFQVRQDRDTHFGELMRAIEQVDALQAECERWKRGSEIRDEQNQDLHSFVMELKAECEKLRQEVEALQGIQPEMPPMPPNGKGLPRYGVRWNGPTQPLSVPKDDGYWTPWHLAQAECALLRAAIRRLCNIYVVDDYYMGQLREERLEAAVNRAIEQVKEANHENQ